MDETIFLTVNIVDKFLERQLVVRKKLQLVGVTAMLLACKYEEVSVPIVDDFILISDNAYTRKEVLDMVIFLPFPFWFEASPLLYTANYVECSSVLCRRNYCWTPYNSTCLCRPLMCSCGDFSRQLNLIKRSGLLLIICNLVLEFFSLWY